MKTLIGLFPSQAEASSAVMNLQKEGYKHEDFSIITKEGAVSTVESTNSTVAENTISGATTGGVLGGLAGLLVGLGAITIPGIGAFLIGGPIAAALGLTGAAATAVSGATTGLLAGGLIGAFKSIGLPESEARIYEERVKQGAVMLAVPLNDREDATTINKIFEECGADQVKVLELN